MHAKRPLIIMNRAIKYRLYPTTEQRIMFAKTFGCCRKVYNLMLSDKIDGYKDKLVGSFGKRGSMNRQARDIRNWLNQWKMTLQEKPYLLNYVKN